jgi:hypothetical protein
LVDGAGGVSFFNHLCDGIGSLNTMIDQVDQGWERFAQGDGKFDALYIKQTIADMM